MNDASLPPSTPSRRRLVAAASAAAFWALAPAHVLARADRGLLEDLSDALRSANAGVAAFLVTVRETVFRGPRLSGPDRERLADAVGDILDRSGELAVMRGVFARDLRHYLDRWDRYPPAVREEIWLQFVGRVDRIAENASELAQAVRSLPSPAGAEVGNELLGNLAAVQRAVEALRLYHGAPQTADDLPLLRAVADEFARLSEQLEALAREFEAHALQPSSE